MPELLRVREVASIAGVVEDTVWVWIRAKKLPAIKLPNGRLRVTREAVNEFLGVTTKETPGKTETKAN